MSNSGKNYVEDYADNSAEENQIENLKLPNGKPEAWKDEKFGKSEILEKNLESNETLGNSEFKKQNKEIQTQQNSNQTNKIEKTGIENFEIEKIKKKLELAKKNLKFKRNSKNLKPKNYSPNSKNSLENQEKLENSQNLKNSKIQESSEIKAGIKTENLKIPKGLENLKSQRNLVNSQNSQNLNNSENIFEIDLDKKLIENKFQKEKSAQNESQNSSKFGVFLIFLLIIPLFFVIGFFANGVWLGLNNSKLNGNSKENLVLAVKINNSEKSENKTYSEQNSNFSNLTNNSKNPQNSLENEIISNQNVANSSENSNNFNSQTEKLENQENQNSQINSQNNSEISNQNSNLENLENAEKMKNQNNFQNQKLEQNSKENQNSANSINSNSQEQKMKNEVIKILDKEVDNFTIYFKNLKTGQKFDIKGEKLVPPASISKLPAAILTLKSAENGEFSFKDGLELQEQFKYIPEDPMYNYQTGVEYPIGEYVRNVIVGSDNTAMRHLEFLHGGTQVYAEKLAKLGIKLTRQPHITTAIDVGNVFEGIYESRWLNKANTDYLLGLIMSENKWNSDRLVLAMKKFPEAKVAHKIGQVSTDNGISYHDAGIIFGPKTDFVIVILNQDTTADTGITKIHQISQYLYSELNR